MERIIFLVQFETVDLEFGQSSCETLAFATKKDAEEKFADIVNDVTRIGSPYSEYKEEVNEETGEHSKFWYASDDIEWGGYFNKHILISITPTELYGENEFSYTNTDMMRDELLSYLECDEELNEKLKKYYQLDSEEKFNKKINEVVELMVSDKHFWNNYDQQFIELINCNEIIKKANESA